MGSVNLENAQNGEKTTSIFKKIDQYLFEQIDIFKSSPPYLKFVELLNSIPREQRLILNQSVTILLIIFPILLLLLFFVSNLRMKGALDTKKEILRVSNEIIAKQRDLRMVKKGLLSYPVIKNKGDLDQKLRTALSRHNINLGHVNSQNFDLDASFPGLFRINADIHFSKLSNAQLVDFINFLIVQEKAKIQRLSIMKDESDGLLKGTFKLVLYGEENKE